MESGSKAGVAATVSGDTGVLTFEDRQFRNVMDEPFITVNWVEGKLLAEVYKSPDPDVTLARIERALAAGRELGQHAWARVHGDFADEGYDVVTIHFTPDVAE